MNWLHLVSYFFGGLFLANAVPHFVSGVMGKPFQSPFAKPSGEGLSSSTVNVLWGFANLVIAYLLLLRVGHFDLRIDPLHVPLLRLAHCSSACSRRGISASFTEATPGAPMKNPLSRAFRALENFNFRLWTAGGLVSNIGTWMQRVAQDWIVLTQLTHHDATAVGIVTGLQFAPQLLLLPWSGLAADRFNQRKLLMLTQASMGVLATALGILTITGYVRLWHVYVFAFVFGAAAALDAPVRQTFVGELVGDEHLPNAVALNSTSFVVGQMIGPAVAGLVIAKIGTGWAFLLNGLSFGAVLLSMYMLRVQELRTTARASRGRVASSKDSAMYGPDRTSEPSWSCSS
jgi:hypothetical protein